MKHRITLTWTRSDLAIWDYWWQQSKSIFVDCPDGRWSGGNTLTFDEFSTANNIAEVLANGFGGVPGDYLVTQTGSTADSMTWEIVYPPSLVAGNPIEALTFTPLSGVGSKLQPEVTYERIEDGAEEISGSYEYYTLNVTMPAYTGLGGSFTIYSPQYGGPWTGNVYVDEYDYPYMVGSELQTALDGAYGPSTFLVEQINDQVVRITHVAYPGDIADSYIQSYSTGIEPPEFENHNGIDPDPGESELQRITFVPYLADCLGSEYQIYSQVVSRTAVAADIETMLAAYGIDVTVSGGGISPWEFIWNSPGDRSDSILNAVSAGDLYFSEISGSCLVFPDSADLLPATAT